MSYFTDPERAPVRENTYLLDDVAQRDGWWRALFPMRSIGQIETFIEESGDLPDDVRQAAQQVLEGFKDDPKKRPRELYAIYRGRLHRKRRLDSRLTGHLVYAAQMRYEAAQRLVSTRQLHASRLFAFKVARDVFQLLELRWWTDSEPR